MDLPFEWEMNGMQSQTIDPAALTHPDRLYAIKTWRYLRLAMVGLVFGLGVSIAFERSKVHPGASRRQLAPTTTHLCAATSSARSLALECA